MPFYHCIPHVVTMLCCVVEVVTLYALFNFYLSQLLFVISAFLSNSPLIYYLSLVDVGLIFDINITSVMFMSYYFAYIDSLIWYYFFSYNRHLWRE